MNRKLSLGLLFSWHKMQVREGAYIPPTHLFENINLLPYLLENNLNINANFVFTYPCVIIRKHQMNVEN